MGATQSTPSYEPPQLSPPPPPPPPPPPIPPQPVIINNITEVVDVRSSSNASGGSKTCSITPFNPAQTVVLSNCKFANMGDGNINITTGGVAKKVADYLKEYPEGKSVISGPKERCCSCSANVQTLANTQNGVCSSPELPQYIGNANELWGVQSVLIPEDGSIGVTIKERTGKTCSYKKSTDALSCGQGMMNNPNIQSVNVQKVCSHSKWAFDTDCNSKTPDAALVYPGSVSSSTLKKNKGTVCSKSASWKDPVLASKCKSFCASNKSLCKNMPKSVSSSKDKFEDVCGNCPCTCDYTGDDIGGGSAPVHVIWILLIFAIMFIFLTMRK